MGFYTLFNVIGVMLILPFIGAYSRLIERLIPERSDERGELLDVSLLKYPELALSDVRKLLGTHIQRLAEQLSHMLGELPRPVSLVETAQALTESRTYLDKLHLAGGEGRAWKDLLACIHLLDHLQRLYERCQNEQVSIKLREEQELQIAKVILAQLVSSVLDKAPLNQEQSELLVQQLAMQERQLRERVMEQIATGKIDLDKGVSLMEASRWIHRVSNHLVRIDYNWEQLNYRPAPKREATA